MPVLPADAGVFRWVPGQAPLKGSPPRRRGGVPWALPSTAPPLPSSPPTRGCSVLRDLQRAGHPVLPADAGVFRGHRHREVRVGGPPRRRGGVPSRVSPGVIEIVSSPPTRGCSVGKAAPEYDRLVLPADAGVFRRCGGGSRAAGGPPRRRGGVPEPSGATVSANESSPPTRGCSARPDTRSARVPVLPADAGVFRPACTARCASAGPPRRRGGVPQASWHIAPGDASSPPTRGCSGHLRAEAAPAGVLPADAGVFRSRTMSSTSSGSPPRRRGGVPKLGRNAVRGAESSPPTRGCSGRFEITRIAAAVLPADAGVFRDRSGPGSGALRPPRRRGGVPLGRLQAAEHPPVLPADAGVFRGLPGPARQLARPPRRRGGVPTVRLVGVAGEGSSPPTRGCSASTS